MKKFTKEPTRRELLNVLSELQNLFGDINHLAYADTGEDRAASIRKRSQEGFDICLNARSFDPP